MYQNVTSFGRGPANSFFARKFAIDKIALSSDCRVGVDVEPVRPLAGIAEVVSEFFPPAGRAAFAAAAVEQKQIVFFRWWTRIEAAVKVCGRGLDAATSCFDGVCHESSEAVPGLALAVAAESKGPLRIDWRVPLVE